MDRLEEIHPGAETFNPAHFRLDGLQTVEPDPQLLSKRRTPDEFDAASVERRVEDLHAVTKLAGATEEDLGVKNLAFAAAGDLIGGRCGHRRALRPTGVAAFNYRSVSDAVQRISATGWITAQAMRTPLLPLGSVM